MGFDCLTQLVERVEGHLGVEVVFDVVVHVHVEPASDGGGGEGSCGFQDGGGVFFQLDMLEQSKQQHDGSAEQAWQEQVCPYPCFAAREQEDERCVDEDAGSGAPFQSAERVFGGEGERLLRELPERVANEHFRLVEDERDAANFQQPSFEGHGCIEGHLAVFVDMPCVGVMAGMGVSAVVGLFEVEERSDPQACFVDPSCSEGGTVRALVADRVGGDGEDGA